MKWLRKQLNSSEHLLEACAIGVAIGIVFGIVMSVYFTPVVETAHAEEVVEVVEAPVEVMIEIAYTREEIIRRIKETFPETPDTAIAIAKCESGLKIDIQSNHTLSYGRELSFGLFQIHAPAWEKRAKALGYDNYRDDLEDNLAMARYIYVQSGYSWRPWSCLKMI